MEFLYLAWLLLIIIFLTVEIITSKLITLWFALGSLFAFVLTLLGYMVIIQIAGFVVFSMILFMARPCLKRFLEKDKNII